MADPDAPVQIGVNRDAWSTYQEMRIPVTSPTWGFPGAYSLAIKPDSARLMSPAGGNKTGSDSFCEIE